MSFTQHFAAISQEFQTYKNFPFSFLFLTKKWTFEFQGSIYGRRDHCQSEYDFKHSEPEICNFYVQKNQNY